MGERNGQPRDAGITREPHTHTLIFQRKLLCHSEFVIKRNMQFTSGFTYSE